MPRALRIGDPNVIGLATPSQHQPPPELPGTLRCLLTAPPRQATWHVLRTLVSNIDHIHFPPNSPRHCFSRSLFSPWPQQTSRRSERQFRNGTDDVFTHSSGCERGSPGGILSRNITVSLRCVPVSRLHLHNRGYRFPLHPTALPGHLPTFPDHYPDLQGRLPACR